MKRLAFAALAAVALVLLYVGLRRHRQVREDRAQQGKKLIHMNLDEVRRVEIERTAEQPARIVLEKRGDDWWLVDPIEYRANKSSVEGFVSTFREKTYDGSFAPVSSTNYGLNPPLYTVRWHGPVTETTLVGKETPFGGKVYAQQGTSADVLLVDGGFQYHLSKKVDEWRDKDVFWEFPEPLSAIASVTETSRWSVNSTDGTHWTGGGFALDTGKVQSLIDRLKNMMVREFISDDANSTLKTYGLDKPRRRLTLTGQDGRTRVLEFGTLIDKDKTYPVLLPERNQIVSISQYIYDNLFKTPQELQPEPPPPPPPTQPTTAPPADMSARPQ